MGVDELLDVYGAVREAVGAEAFVGINPLGGDPVEVVRDAIETPVADRHEAVDLAKLRTAASDLMAALLVDIAVDRRG